MRQPAKRKPKPKVSKKTKRVYNNESREDSSVKNRQAIILALVDLLVESSGADVGMAEIAKKSGISQRTIFRFFKDKAALQQATRDYIGGYLQAASAHLSEINLTDFAKLIFSEFDGEPKLAMAYVLSPFGQAARVMMRKALNKNLTARFAKDYGVKSTKENQDRISFIVSLVNARVWYEMKTDFGLSGSQSGEILTWAITTLAKELKREQNS